MLNVESVNYCDVRAVLLGFGAQHKADNCLVVCVLRRKNIDAASVTLFATIISANFSSVGQTFVPCHNLHFLDYAGSCCRQRPLLKQPLQRHILGECYVCMCQQKLPVELHSRITWYNLRFVL